MSTWYVMNKWLKKNVRGRAALAIVLTSAALACAGASRAAEPGTPPSTLAPHQAVPSSKKASAPTAPVKLVDINSASRDELKTLPGIDDARATKIIAGRPYLAKTDLVTSNVLPTGIYISIKYRIIAVPTAKAVPKK